MADSTQTSKHREHVTETPDVSHIRNVDVTHELSDINVPAVLKFVLFLTFLTIIVYVLMWGLFRLLDRRVQKSEPPPSPMAMSDRERLPPEPRLQGATGFAEDLANTTGAQDTQRPRDPMWEYRVLHQKWEDELERGLRDQRGRTVGMPIDEAMKRITEDKSLPVRPNASKPGDYGIWLPTAASSGRVTEKRVE